MSDVKINPYGFVPLGSEPERTQWQDVFTHERFQHATYSGQLMLRITTLTPIIIPSRIGDEVEEVLCQCSPECRKKADKKSTFTRFQHRNERPIIPATSVKGMLRSVFEALTNSCMALFGATYGFTTYPTSTHKHEFCQKENGLCPACRVFGTIQGDDLLFQGKVRLSDVVGHREDLEKGDWVPKELSSPKPERHVPFYATDGKGPESGPRGRKFYYHHRNPCDQAMTQTQHNHRNVRITERLKTAAVLQATLDFQGLTEDETAALLFAIELDLREELRQGKSVLVRSLAHKIGMGKPLGLGSVGITIVSGNINQGAERYRGWVRQPADLRAQIVDLKSKAPSPSMYLHDVLSRQKDEQGDIEYPGYRWFDNHKSNVLGELGVFDDLRPVSPPISLPTNQPPSTRQLVAQATTPIGGPLIVKKEEQAVWLKEMWEKELVFVTLEGKQARRKYDDFQAKKELLQVGYWYILSGTRSVKPVR